MTFSDKIKKEENVGEIKRYRFVGAVTQIGETEYNQIGQRAEMTEEDHLRLTIDGNVSFVSEEDFEEIFADVSADDLARYSNPFFFGTPSEEYLRAVEQARDKVRRSRDGQAV